MRPRWGGCRVRPLLGTGSWGPPRSTPKAAASGAVLHPLPPGASSAMPAVGGCKPASPARCKGAAVTRGSGSGLSPLPGVPRARGTAWPRGQDARARGVAVASLPGAGGVSSVVSTCGIQPDRSLRCCLSGPLHPCLSRFWSAPGLASTPWLCRRTPAPAPGRSAAPRAVWGQLRDECEHIVWAPAAGVTVSLLESEQEPQPRRDKRLWHSRSHAHAGAAAGLGHAVAQPALPLHRDPEGGSG